MSHWASNSTVSTRKVKIETDFWILNIRCLYKYKILNPLQLPTIRHDMHSLPQTLRVPLWMQHAIYL